MEYNELDLTILKGIISNKQNAAYFLSSYDTKIFSSDFWNFANTILSYYKNYKEIPTLNVIEESFGKNNKALSEYCKKVWTKLDEHKCNDKEFAFNLQKLKNKYVEKQLSNFRENLVKNQIDNTNYEKCLQDLQRVNQNIKSVREKKTYESKSIKEYLPQFREQLINRRNNPDIEIGIKSGFSFFDDSTNGVKSGDADFVLIIGESGFGKSTYLLNAAVGTWLQSNSPIPSESYKKGHDIAYFSLEMPYENCFMKLISRLSGIAYKKIEKPSTLTKEEITKLKTSLDFIYNYPYNFEIIDIPNANSNDIDAILDDLSADVAFVDYLGIMTTNEKTNEEQDWLKQGIAAYELRSVVRKRGTPIYSAVQMNRKSSASKDPEDTIGLHRLARSNQIATHATIIVQLEARKNEENFPDMNYHLIKNRNGPKGRGKVIKNLACATLIDSPILKPDEEDMGFIPYNEDIENDLEEFDI